MDNCLAFFATPDFFYGDGLLFFIVLLALAFFWVTQFVQFMLLEDRIFPGKFDKIIWGAAFVLLPPVAPFAFRIWKSARRAAQMPGTASPPVA